MLVKSGYPRDVGILRDAFLLGGTYYIDEVMSIRRLFNIDGYNYRLREKGDRARAEVIAGDFDHEIDFDRFTNYKFHKEITKSNISKAIRVSMYDVETARSLWQKGGFGLKDLRVFLDCKATLMSCFQVILFLISPELTGSILRMRQRYKKKGH